MSNYDRLEEAEIKRSKIFGFFDRFLPPKYDLANENMSTGKSEPVVGPEVLTELRDFMEEKRGMDTDQLKGSTSVSNFIPVFTTKKEKILAYRTMYMYPDIHKSVSIVVNTAISENEMDELITLKFKNDKIPEAIQAKMSGIFDYLIYDVFDVDNNLEALFKKFLIEGELYIELVTDDDTKNITGYHVLPNYSTVPIYDNTGSNIKGYVQYPEVIINGMDLETDGDFDSQDIEDAMKDGLSGSQYMKLSNGVFGSLNGSDNSEMDSKPIDFLPNQVAYANNGTYGTSLYDVSGYLEPVRKTYNIMNTVDDALAVYRFVRAPETRLWNVFTNGLPPTKADAYLDTVIKEFRKDYNYNPESGEFSQSGIFNSIIDDYFFAVGEDGNKTTVDSLSGAMNLDQLKDVEIHHERLMQGLQIPRSRWDKELMRDWTARNETTTGEERQFSLLVKSLGRNFSQVFKQAFDVLCRSKGVPTKYLKTRNYNIELSNVNDWEFWQNLEVFKAKAETFEAMKGQIISEENPEGMLPPKFVFEKVFKLSAADEELRQSYMEEYLAQKEKKDKNILEKEWLDEDEKTVDVSNVYPFQSKYLFDHNIKDDVDAFEGYDFQSKYTFTEDSEPEVEDDADFEIDDAEEVYEANPEDKKYFYDSTYLYGTEDDEDVESEEEEFEEESPIEVTPITQDTGLYNFQQAYLYDIKTEQTNMGYDFNQKYLYDVDARYNEAGDDIDSSGYNYNRDEE
jgi:hypothetical protein